MIRALYTAAIRSSLEGLKSLLGTPATAPAVSQPAKSSGAAGGAGLGSDMATFSSAASEVAQTAGDSSVRMDKVAGIQAALAAGSYNVSAGAVASKVVDSMLAGQQ
ncbi:MAG: flagellar biosynthesis anti-sigma factor FlgM [Terracidiphilus sp.]|jgi:negative regulator of flagellin synthesis FlgM